MLRQRSVLALSSASRNAAVLEERDLAVLERDLAKFGFSGALEVS